MTIKQKTVSVSYWAVDSGLYQITLAMMRTQGVSLDDANMLMSPLYWYWGTGRASCDFLRKLLTAKPYMIARKVYQGGTNEEVIKRVKEYIGYVD